MIAATYACSTSERLCHDSSLPSKLFGFPIILVSMVAAAGPRPIQTVVMDSRTGNAAWQVRIFAQLGADESYTVKFSKCDINVIDAARLF